MRNPWTLATGLVAGLLAVCPMARAGNVSIDFKLLGTVTTASLAVKDVVITGDDGAAPAMVHMLNLNGLGIVGGAAANLIDGNEAIRFDFQTLASNAKYHVGQASNLNGDGKIGTTTLEAFVGATSLGTVAVDDIGWKDVSALFGGVAVTGFRVRAAIDGIRIDAMSYTTHWDSLGNGLAGSHGVPVLGGAGYFVPGLGVTVTASQMLENRTAALAIGLQAINAPFKGGVLVPSLDVLVPGLSTGPTGEIALTGAWPNGVPPGFSFYLQMWLADPAGPHGFAATNGLKATTP